MDLLFPGAGGGEQNKPNREKSALSDVVSALGDVIRSQQIKGKEHEPTSTEYFAVILSSINSGKHDEHLGYLLNILGAVIPSSSQPVVRSQFKQLGGCLLKIAKANAEDTSLLASCLETLGSAMRAQETSDGFWGAVYSLQSINAFLACIDDSRYRIRKICNDQLIMLLRHHKKAGARAVRSYVGDFCLGVLRSCSRSEYKRSLFIILFLESSTVYFPENMICTVCDTALKLQACEQPVLTSAVCRMIDALYQNSFLSLSGDKCHASIQILLDMKPATNDMEANTYFCTALASGLAYLHKIDASLSNSLLPPAILSLVAGCETEFTQIHCAVGSALKRIISGCLDSVTMTPSSSTTGSSSILVKVVQAMETLLQLKYQHSWLYIMDAVRSLFDRFKGDEAKSLLSGITFKLADLYQAINNTALQVDPGVEVALGDTLGASLRSCGFTNFLSIVPFRDASSPAFNGIDASREWILSILHSNLKMMRCKLADFGSTVLPVASACSQALQNANRFSLSETQLHTIRNRILQLWSLFPEFISGGPTDVPESFPKLVKILEAAMKDIKYPEILPHVVVGLTHLAKGACDRCPYSGTSIGGVVGVGRDSAELATLREYAQIFVPAVLIYLEGSCVGDSRFQTGVQFIAAWAGASPPPLLIAVSKKLLQLLLTSTGAMGGSDSEAASVWMAVVQAIIPHMPETMVTLLYRTVRPLLSVNESVSLQKRAYHVLDSLVRHHGAILTATETRMEILNLIVESLLTCQVSARSMRLRCMESLMATMGDEEIQAATGVILGEILICQKDANKKTRDSATELLLMMIRRMAPYDMLTQLCSGLAGETSVMRSAAVTGLCLLMLEHRGDTELMKAAADLISTVSLLLKDECPEETRAVLSYVRVCAAVLPARGGLEGALPQMVFAFSEGLGPHKAKFSSRIRAIMRKLFQRVDTDVLRSLLSEPDQALLEYIERRARKAARKKDVHMVDANRIDKMLGSDSEDSDDDDSRSMRGSVAGKSTGGKTIKSMAKSMGGKSIKSMTEKSMANGRGLKEKEDPRLASRPKAVYANDVRDNYPSSLQDLLDDQPASYLGVRSAATLGKERLTVPGGRGSKGGKSSVGDREDDEDEEYTVAVTADGRVVVQARELTGDMGMDRGGAVTGAGGMLGGRKGAREEAEAESVKAAAVEAALKKRQRLKEPGEEYRSRKAGGDVWKKGMLEPHAYIPLDPRLLNKKNHKEAIAHFGAVVKSGKKTRISEVIKGKKSHVVVGNRNQRRTTREHSLERKGSREHSVERKDKQTNSFAKF